MNESEIENELRRSRPASPSAGLHERIAVALREASAPAEPAWPARMSHLSSAGDVLRLWLDRLLWAGLGAAALFLVTLWQRPAFDAGRDPTTGALRIVAVTAVPLPPVAPGQLQQVLSSDETMHWRDEGVHFDERGQPVLTLRRTAVEHQAWADPLTAGVVQVEVPRQEVMYVPLSLH